MRRLVPGIAELVVLLAISVVCAAVVAIAGPREVAVLPCGFAMLLVSMLLGARRAGHLRARKRAATSGREERAACCEA